MSALLEINSVSGGYREGNVIKNVSLDINHGDFLGIIGPNGSGKTTLLRLATRILLPRQGSISFRQKDIFQMPLKAFCCNVAFVSQDAPSDFSFTVMEIVLMGRLPHLKRLQFETKRDIKIAQDALKAVDIFGLREKFINELSAGERQRVLIARALAQEPGLLLLDEPTSHLDIGHQIQILDLLKKLNRASGLAIAIILHDLNLAAMYCNRIAMFDNGAVYTQGPADEVLTYQNIEAVYKTVVVVNNNPITNRPNVILVSGVK